MILIDDNVDLGAALTLKTRSTAIRVVIMGVIGAMLYSLADWKVAPAWWVAYALLQLLVVQAQSSAVPAKPFRLYGLSALAYAVAGFPAWHLWKAVGDLGIATATMFLCGMLVQLVVSSLGARRLFWASASPLIAYLLIIPPLAFGQARLVEGLAVSACGVLLVGYLTMLWLGQQRAIEALRASRLRAEILQKEAEAASQAKTDFLAAMSHELRTPMNAVLGAADLLGRTDLTPAQKELLDMLADGGSVLMHVLNDVLDLAKIEAGKLSIDPSNTDVYDFVRRCGALWAPRAEDRGLGFRIQIAPDTPQFVSLDAARVGQIIFNLVSNALKFTEAGEVRLDLGSEPGADGEIILRLSVTDTGMGMSPDIQSRLFTAFQQADGSISRKFGGTGLGLSISQKLAQMMGGQITVSSQEAVGSTFSLTLTCPLGVAEDLETAEQQDDPDGPRQALRILVAEDNPSNQRIIDLFLRPLGADVTIVGDGQQALDALSTSRFDLVLMDMQMPVMDGLEATRGLRASGGPNAEIPVLALTANVMDVHREACRQAGMTGHISKPIDARQLLASVITAVDGSLASRLDETDAISA
jgi:hypothetical protein